MGCLFNVKVRTAFPKLSSFDLSEIQNVIDQKSEHLGAGVLNVDTLEVLLLNGHQLGYDGLSTAPVVSLDDFLQLVV